jgi:hypothetical protein
VTFGEDVLLLSDPWEHGPAGLHAYDGDSFTEFDRLATSGLARVGDSRVARLVRTAVTALLVYDKRGVERDELDHSSCAEASVVLRGPNG